jgi:hypothetical protein
VGRQRPDPHRLAGVIVADDEPGGLTREERCDVKDLHLINRDLLASMLQVSSGPLQ